MTGDKDFQKPQQTPTSAPFRNAMANANLAREMVNMHLQGRNPQMTQTSQAIHARAHPGVGKEVIGEKEPVFKNMSLLSRPKSDTGRENNTGLNSSRVNLDTTHSEVNTGNSGVTRDSAASTNTNTNTKPAGEAEVTHGHTHSSVHTHVHARVLVPAAAHEGPCKNPPCDHCGTVIIPSPKASWPAHEQPSISVNDWSIYTTKGPICLSEELDHLNDTRFDFPLPEMIFGKNRVVLVNDKTGASIDFNTLDALDSLAPTTDFKVAYYKEWLSTRPRAHNSVVEGDGSVSQGDLPRSNDTIGSGNTSGTSGTSTTGDTNTNSTNSTSSNETSSTSVTNVLAPVLTPQSTDLQLVKPYDWTYSTNYKGTLRQCKFVPTTQDIPLDKLVRQDPILFYDESILFEDELGDNGISMFLTRIRVMHLCLLLLCHFSMRVDDVAFRIRDTRIYIDLETNVVLREYKQQQALYDELLGKISGRSVDPKKLLRDSNWVSQNTPLVLREVEIMVPNQQ